MNDLMFFYQFEHFIIVQLYHIFQQVDEKE
jgi:hypothetical protein